MCDDVLGESAEIDTETPEKFPAFLQVRAVCHALSTASGSHCPL